VSSIVLQRLARVSMLGIDVDARTDLADEPCLEAEDLGRLLEYERPRAARQLVRRLIENARLSARSPRCVATENSADNSMVVATDQRPADVFVVEQHGQVGTVVRTTEQLWLTERACLLVATASDTDRAWQVREALVDFFVHVRRERIGASGAALTQAQALVDEARAIREDVARQLELDKRVRQLEQRRERRPLAATPTSIDGATLEASLNALLEQMADDAEISIPDIAKALELDLDEGLSKKLGILLARIGWAPTRRLRVSGERHRMYHRPAVSPLEALAAVVVPVLEQHPEGLTTTELLATAGAAIDAARGRRTLAMPLGKELARLVAGGYPIEHGWSHGHVSRWRLKARTA
jgi:hypothetical protein